MSREAPFIWTAEQGMPAILVPDLWFGYASDINDRDEVVGSYVDLSGTRHSFLWSPQLGFVDVGTEFVAVAINNRRQIAGRCPGQFNEEFQEVAACVWEDGIVRQLGFSVGYDWFDQSSWAPIDMNDRGEVVGGTRLWSATKGLLELPLAAHAISNSGLIVGHTGEHTVVWSRRRWILRKASRDLIPTEINSRGWVVGLRWIEAQPTAFLWLPSGKIVTLPSPARPRVSYAGDINDRGQVAGNIGFTDGSIHAAVWTVRAANAKKKTAALH